MKRIDNKKNLYKSIILLAILVIGIGYAYLTSNLSISGQTEVVANTWDIHFENLNVKDGSVITSNPAIINSDNTTINYSITLSRPKDYYEFTVDVKNDGTLPGKVSISSLSGLDTTSSKVIDYTIMYTNGNPVSIGDILNAGSKKKIKVRVFYKDDISEIDFPSNNLNLTLTYTLQYVQSEEDVFDADALVEQLKTGNSSCFTKYEGQVTDQVGETVTASNVYFNKCVDKRNIIFNNMCWQMIRTTETGGIKMVYNGEVVDGKCGSTRGTHKGIVGTAGLSQTLNASYLYGDSFTYDITNNTFTLTNTITATWSDSTYENLLGKFTCKTTSDTCTTLYNVNGRRNNESAYASSYTIGDTNYAQIGTSAFNANTLSLATAGYMFNKVYIIYSLYPNTTEYKYGSGFTYDTNTNTYTLSGTTQNISNWSTEYNQINNTHYTCWNTSGTCSTISYIFFTTSSSAFHVDISGGKSVEDIIEEMLFANDVNRYSSSMKGILDAWYKQNLLSKTNMLEDTVYCNARNITTKEGWNPNGGSTTIEHSLQFKNHDFTTDLSCSNELDQFAVGNISAKLTYPVSLINNEEWNNIGTNSLRQTGDIYWSLSPLAVSRANAYVNVVFTDGNFDSTHVNYPCGSRPAVTLKNDVLITEGDGTETNPWVIE